MDHLVPRAGAIRSVGVRATLCDHVVGGSSDDVVIDAIPFHCQVPPRALSSRSFPVQALAIGIMLGSQLSNFVARPTDAVVDYLWVRLDAGVWIVWNAPDILVVAGAALYVIARVQVRRAALA